MLQIENVRQDKTAFETCFKNRFNKYFRIFNDRAINLYFSKNKSMDNWTQFLIVMAMLIVFAIACAIDEYKRKKRL